MSDKIFPFYCGSQYVDWQMFNCDNCKKFDVNDPTNSNCEIDAALLDAQFDEGAISPEIAKRMDVPKDATEAYVWRCGEYEDNEL